MLTPSFHISQTDELLIITIHAPYTQLKALETTCTTSMFWFYSSPYYLRLFFPCEVEEDDEPPTKFDSDTGEFEVILHKKIAGEHFPDLDLLATLLAPKKQIQNIKPSIEVISADNEEGEEDVEDEDPDEWLIDQEIPISPSELINPLNAPRYGFGNQTQGVFRQVKTEFKEIIDLPDPDSLSVSQRLTLMRAEEDEKFCSDHYLADFMEPEILVEYLKYKTPWTTETPDTVKLTGEEREALKKLGNKEFLLSKEDKIAAWLSLVDIIFSYAYNHRTTLGENTVESAWTINKISPTLSWFTTHTSIHGVVVCCFRRVLTYSLFRNWDLAQLVLQDTINILKLGRRQVLKCLLEVHSLFTNSEPRFLLNQLYITDYCIWLQKLSDHKLAKLTDSLEKVQILKEDVEFDLLELEQAAVLVQMEEEDLVDSLSKKVHNLNLDKPIMRSPSSSSIDSESSYSGSNSTSLDSDDESSPES